MFFSRYCNSHLQVLGFIPKKERKKKHDALDSVALNITVPSLALKVSNGLDGLPPSPPCTRLIPLTLPDPPLLDPFAFFEEDLGVPDDTTRSDSISKKKVSQHGVVHDSDSTQPISEPLKFGKVTCTLPKSPHLTSPAPPPPPPPPQHAGGSSYMQGAAQAVLCKQAPSQPGASQLPSVPQSAGQQFQKTFLTAPSQQPTGVQECSQRQSVVMRPIAFTAPPACLSRLQHLVQLCAQRHKDHKDLFPHLGKFYYILFKCES